MALACCLVARPMADFGWARALRTLVICNSMLAFGCFAVFAVFVCPSFSPQVSLEQCGHDGCRKRAAGI